MSMRLRENRRTHRILVTVFVVALAAISSVPVFAQSFGAIQAVRQRASGLQDAGAGPGPGQPTPGEAPPGPGPGVGEQPASPGSAAKLDLAFVSPSALLVAVIRPAQFMAAPVVQLLPTEVAAAASREWLGVDLAEIDEVVAFVEFGNPTQPMLGFTYGLTFKFKSQFRAAAIPEKVRPMVQLAELNSKKYLKSAHPLFPSFYGPNNKTLVAAPDATIRKIVEASTQPKTGPLMEKAQQAPAGSDLYLAIDGARARGLLPIALGMGGVQIPEQAKPLIEAIASAELTLNLVSRGPISLVVHCNDEAAAAQIETLLAERRQKMMAAAEVPTAVSEQPAPGPEPSPSPPGGKYAQEMQQFKERMNQRFQPQRNGASLTLFQIAADDPLQQQLFGIVVGAAATAASMKSSMPTKAGPPSPGAAPPPATEGAPNATPPTAATDGAAPPPVQNR